jgi:hypothetical protein
MECDSPACPTARLASPTRLIHRAQPADDAPGDPGHERDRDSEDDVPETPLDEPPPPRVDDPPPQPDQKGPYVVSA